MKQLEGIGTDSGAIKPSRVQKQESLSLCTWEAGIQDYLSQKICTERY